MPGLCNGDPWRKTEQESSQGGADEAEAHQGGTEAHQGEQTKPKPTRAEQAQLKLRHRQITNDYYGRDRVGHRFTDGPPGHGGTFQGFLNGLFGL